MKINKKKKSAKTISMLDYLSKSVLKFLVDSCGEGAYKIIDTAEIMENMPAKVRATPQSVGETIKHLENSGYISVKYSDNNQYCLSPRAFGRQVVENENNSKIKNKIAADFVLCFVSAFFGALLGTILSVLIF